MTGVQTCALPISAAPVPIAGWTVDPTVLTDVPHSASPLPMPSKLGAHFGDENNPFHTITNMQTSARNTIDPVQKEPAHRNIAVEQPYSGLRLKERSPQRAVSAKPRASSALTRNALGEVTNQRTTETQRSTKVGQARPDTAGVMTRRRAAAASTTAATAGALPFTIFEDSRKSRGSITPKKTGQTMDVSNGSSKSPPYAWNNA